MQTKSGTSHYINIWFNNSHIVVSSVMSCQFSGDGSTVGLMTDTPPFMKAIRIHKFGGPDVLHLESGIPVPHCSDTQVLIRVSSIGVNPIDTYWRSGSYDADKLPFTPGTDCAGTVAAVGSKVTKFQLTDRVYTCKTVNGSYAEYCLAEEVYTFALHDKLNFNQGAALGIPYFTAYKAILKKARCRPGQTILVHGASGGVGLACCQIARGCGLHVMGTAGTDKGLDIVRANGAHAAFNHRTSDYVEKIRDHVGQNGVDIICEMLACKNLNNDISLLGKNGKVIVIGSRGKILVTPSHLFHGEIKIEGVSILSSTAEEYDELAMAVHAGVENGWVNPVISNEYSLVDAPAAHRDVIEHKLPTCGKIVLTVS